MKKQLSEMTLEELWELFPIFLVPHNERWSGYFEEMKTELLRLLSGAPVYRISHIGSTAIPGICAKNIIDILIETDANRDPEDTARILEQNGWLRMSSEANRISLNQGYTENGFAEKVWHLHLRRAGDNDELYFRDYLNDHPQIAKEYEQLKLALWKRYEHHRDGYTDAKSGFVRKWTAEAKRLYRRRYEPV